MKTTTRSLLLIFLCTACYPKLEKESASSAALLTYDSHVHLMSPGLIAEWKALGIPFSRSEAYYSDIDTLFSKNKVEHLNLVGMGYVYENPDFYQAEDRYERLKKENDYLLMTAQKYPKQIRPFFTVDPLKENALDEFNRCIAFQPASGLKLHFNSSQVYLTEPEHLARVKPLFQRAAEKKIPILLHFDNGHPKFGAPDVYLLADSILKDLPPLKLSIAHFGTSGGFNQKTKRVLDAFINLFDEGQITAMHQLFFDISAVALDKDSDGVPKLTGPEFEELNQYIHKLGVEKVVFGTDYPLYTSQEYLNILKTKVGLTDEELATIVNNVAVFSSN